MRRSALLLLLASFALPNASAQMTRERADAARPVELFRAPTLITGASVTGLPRGNANFTIRHAFGPVSSGIDDLFGLDGSANIRFGLDFGVTDRLSIGIGRSRFEKLYDAGLKAAVLTQKTSGTPLSVSVKGDIGVTTEKNGYAFTDRLSFFGAVLVGRRVSDRLTIQITPMWSHVNTVVVQTRSDGSRFTPEHDHLAVGVAIGIGLTDWMDLLVEAIPVVGTRTPDTRDPISVGLDIETGGHVFQVFVTASPWLTEQQAIARTTDGFFDGDFRFGFNVNRVFGLGAVE